MAKKSPAFTRQRRQELRQLAQLLVLLEGRDVDELSRIRAMRLTVEAMDDAIDHSIGQARRDGEAWSAIGAALGISPQGAYQRFQKSPVTDIDGDSGAVSAESA
jgi:hypothetical protein